jgi:hypothetical protein
MPFLAMHDKIIVEYDEVPALHNGVHIVDPLTSRLLDTSSILPAKLLVGRGSIIPKHRYHNA